MNKLLILFLLILSLSLIGCKNNNIINSKDYYLNCDIEEMEIHVDEEKEIIIETNIDKSLLTWFSNEEDIATINNGIVKGIKKGFTVISCSYESHIIEISITVRPKLTPTNNHKIIVYGYDEFEIRDGVSYSYALNSRYGSLLHKNYDDLNFIGWYIDSSFSNELDLTNKIYNDITLYPKYEKDNTKCDIKLAINNTLFYESNLLNDTSIEVFTSDYGKTIKYNEENYINDVIIVCEYDYATNLTYIKSIAIDGSKDTTAIPYNGFVIKLPKLNVNYESYISNLKVNDKVSLDRYSINVASKIYINKELKTNTYDSISLELDSKFVSVYDYTNNLYLYQKNSDSLAYPASTTKIICALAALEHASVDTLITVGDELDVTYEGSSPSTAGLKKGETWTLRHLLYALMLPSGNDAAYVIAAGVARSIEGNESLDVREQLSYFNDLMNDVAKKVNANNSHFMVPDGNSYYNSDGSWNERLSNHYVTSNDMIKFAILALNYSMLAKVVSTYSISFKNESDKSYAFYNTNSLIKPYNNSYYIKDAIGIKTGTTTPGGCCLICAFEKDGRIIIASILKGTASSNRYLDAINIYNKVYEKA